jgi:hypothetical protein
MTDRLAEAEQLIIDTQQVNEHGFPIPYSYDARKLDLIKVFQLFYWLVAYIKELEAR